MLRKKVNGIEWLEFELLQGLPLRHGVFLRHGGVSVGEYSSLNASMGCGDNAVSVKENRRRMEEALGVNEAIYVRAVHKSDFAIVPFLGEPEADVLITNELGKTLAMTHADCQVAIMYDPINRVVANIHAGWRGNVAEVYQKTVKAMHGHFGTKAENLLVCISPSLGPESAEFIHYRRELPEHFWEFRLKECHFDLWAVAHAQLREAGVLSEHIEIARICTYLNKSDYFSYRREKSSGRHSTLVQMQTGLMLA